MLVSPSSERSACGKHRERKKDRHHPRVRFYLRLSYTPRHSVTSGRHPACATQQNNSCNPVYVCVSARPIIKIRRPSVRSSVRAQKRLVPLRCGGNPSGTVRLPYQSQTPVPPLSSMSKRHRRSDTRRAISFTSPRVVDSYTQIEIYPDRGTRTRDSAIMRHSVSLSGRNIRPPSRCKLSSPWWTPF